MLFRSKTGIALSKEASPDANVDYFNSLPEHVKPLVNAVLENRVPLAGRAPLDKKSMTQLFGVVSNVDPTYDATNFQKRQQTAVAFSKGPQSNAIRGANQALYHMGNLYQRTENLNNTGILPGIINPIVNYIEEKGFGDQGDSKIKYEPKVIAAIGSDVSRKCCKLSLRSALSLIGKS